MQIQEQEWALDAYGDVCRGVTSLATHTNATPDEMRAMAAAPKMARALLAQGETSTEGVWHTHACWKTKRAMCLPECIEALDALRSAGVL